MTFLVLTFVVAASIPMATYWLFVLRPEDAMKSSAVKRIGAQGQIAKGPRLVKAPERLSSIKWLEALLKRTSKSTGRTQRLLTESGVEMNVGTFVSLCFFAAATGFAVGYWFLQLWFAGVGLAVLGLAAPVVFLKFKRARRLATFEEQFPEAMDLIARALRAGHAFTTGIGMVADELPAPVGAEFKRLYDEQNFGRSLPDAMRAMADRIPVLDAKFFVTAVLTQRESGGNLSEVLDNLAAVMRERFKLKRQIRVISAHGRISALVLAAMPPVLAAMLFMVSPTLMSILVNDPLGVRLVLIALTLQIIGSIIISRMVKIEY